MNAEDLVNNFSYLVNAPAGPMRLRELMLQLAFSGDLTSRDVQRVPASTIFSHIQEVKANLVAEGKIRQQPLLSPVSLDEHPWKLPEEWLWCRLGEVTNYGVTEKVDFSDVASNTWVLELEDIEKDTSRVLTKVRAKKRKFQSPKNRFAQGDVLYGKLRPYLNKVVLADEEGVCTTEIVPITAYADILPRYIWWFLKSPFFKAYAMGATHGMNLPRMGTESGRRALFPLSSPAEQTSIVAKLEELMIMCDQLEAQQQEREQRIPPLSRACHARLTEVPSIANLDRIFDESGTLSPNDLRRTVFKLAIDGKLVPQSLSDGTADSILSALKTKKAAINKNERSKAPGPFIVDESLTLLPSSWKWARTEDICEVIVDCPHTTPRFIDKGFPCIDTNSFKNGRLIPSKIRYVAEETYEERNKRLAPQPGDIVFAREGSVGDSVIIPEGMKCCLGQRVMLFRLLSPMLPAYFRMALSEESSLNRLLVLHKGIGAKHVNVADMRAALIPIPPIAEQEKIVLRVNHLLFIIDNLERQQLELRGLAEDFARACIASFSGTSSLKKPEKMKVPKTELVSIVMTGRKAQPGAKAPLAILLSRHKGEMAAKALWQLSGLEIAAFYQQLKAEISQGWIAKPAEAEVKILENT